MELYQSQVRNRNASLIYLATMQVKDAESRRRVNKHRKLREGKGFLTIEQERDVAEIVRSEYSDIIWNAKRTSVLLECMSNLVANEMFRDHEVVSPQEVAEKVCRDTQKLYENCRNLVVVTNNVFEDGMSYDAMTLNYLHALAEVNRSLTRQADEVIEVVAGIPVNLMNS